MKQSKSGQLVVVEKRGASALFQAPVPAIVVHDGPRTVKRFLEFFAAQIRNPNTRAAYARASARFFDWCLDQGIGQLVDIEPIHVAAWLELRIHEVSIPSAKQELAAVRKLFDWLVVGHIVETNPATAVRGPSHSVTIGKTPILSSDETRTLLQAIPDSTIAGLRDRALVGLMVYTFARISASINMNVGDVFREKRRLRVRLHEKGGKEHQMPCHHSLEAYLLDYIEAAGLSDDPDAPLFQTIGRGTEVLSGRRLNRTEAWYMVRRRAKAAGLDTAVCNHTFRGTGITAYLEHPDAKLEEAQKMAAHSDPKTTRIYDRRKQDVTQDEVERIRI